jgi:hypothetical protein
MQLGEDVGMHVIQRIFKRILSLYLTIINVLTESCLDVLLFREMESSLSKLLNQEVVRFQEYLLPNLP